MRVLSPRIEPPLRFDDGSTARIAMRWPRSITCRPNASMKVDLPTPGTPLMPRRPDLPVCGSRSEEHTSELQSLMRISYAVFCLKKKKKKTTKLHHTNHSATTAHDQKDSTILNIKP